MSATQIIVTEAGLLLAVTVFKKLWKEIIVFRSPVVRNDDKLIQPLMAAVVGQCVTVEHKEVLDDPEYRLGLSEHYVVSIHPECPPGPHICNADPNEVFNMNERAA